MRLRPRENSGAFRLILRLRENAGSRTGDINDNMARLSWTWFREPRVSSLACPQRHGRRGPYIQGQAPSAGPKPRVMLEVLRGVRTVNGLGFPVGAACRDEASRRLQYFWRGLSGLIGRILPSCGFVAGVRAVASRAVKKLQPSGACVVDGGRRCVAERSLGTHRPPAARPSPVRRIIVRSLG